MANRYVYTGGSNTSPYDTWAKAATTLTTGLTGAAATDVIFVAHDHAESTGALVTLTSPAPTSAPFVQVICVNRAGSVPPVSADIRTTATITTTGNFGITLTGWFYFYGLSFITGSGATGTATLTLGSASGNITMVDCKLRLATTGSVTRMQTLVSNTMLTWENVTVQFGNTGQAMDIRGTLVWRKTPVAAVVAGTVPTLLFQPGGLSNYVLEGLDLSNASGLFSVTSNTGPSFATIKDCRTSVTISAPTSLGINIDVSNCDSIDTNTRNQRHRYNGVETTETTIVRTGGASDGVTTVSRKTVTTGQATWRFPFDCLPFAIWNETVGSAITLTVECIASAVLNNDDVWMDVEYLGTSGVPLGNFATTTKSNILTTGTANTTSTETWGGALTGKFKLAATITPQEKGWIYVYPRVGKASTTVYIDPKITVT